VATEAHRTATRAICVHYLGNINQKLRMKLNSNWTKYLLISRGVTP